MTPTARALRECKRRGWDAQTVERFNYFTKRRHDLFGVIDIIAIGENTIMALQVTGGDGGNHAARVAKIRAEPRAKRWIECGGVLAVWSYAMRGKSGKRKTYVLREELITLPYFTTEQPQP